MCGLDEILVMILVYGVDLCSINCYGGIVLILVVECGYVVIVCMLLCVGVVVDYVNCLYWIVLLEVILFGDGGICYV